MVRPFTFSDICVNDVSVRMMACVLIHAISIGLMVEQLITCACSHSIAGTKTHSRSISLVVRPHVLHPPLFSYPLCPYVHVYVCSSFAPTLSLHEGRTTAPHCSRSASY